MDRTAVQEKVSAAAAQEHCGILSDQGAAAISVSTEDVCRQCDYKKFRKLVKDYRNICMCEKIAQTSLQLSDLFDTMEEPRGSDSNAS